MIVKSLFSQHVINLVNYQLFSRIMKLYIRKISKTEIIYNIILPNIHYYSEINAYNHSIPNSTQF